MIVQGTNIPVLRSEHVISRLSLRLCGVVRGKGLENVFLPTSPYLKPLLHKTIVLGISILLWNINLMVQFFGFQSSLNWFGLCESNLLLRMRIHIIWCLCNYTFLLLEKTKRAQRIITGILFLSGIQKKAEFVHCIFASLLLYGCMNIACSHCFLNRCRA